MVSIGFVITGVIKVNFTNSFLLVLLGYKNFERIVKVRVANGTLRLLKMIVLILNKDVGFFVDCFPNSDNSSYLSVSTFSSVYEGKFILFISIKF